MRSYDRKPGEFRPVDFQVGFTANADGSVLARCGETKVICTAFLEERVPGFLKGQKRGWITAEYGMLPGATHSRMNREAARGKQSGRTIEISRLIGRSLRICVDMERLGENTVTVDCDVIQADGGTRTTAITGGMIALTLCLWKYRNKFSQTPLTARVAAISLGIIEDEVLVDLDYREDSSADVDLNLVKVQDGRFVEIQGTAEKTAFAQNKLLDILQKGGTAIDRLLDLQAKAMLDHGVPQSWVL